MKAILQLDWLSLLGKTEDAYQHLKQLLETGQTQLQCLPNTQLEKQLWSLYWAQRSALRLKGQEVLFFQYPYFQYPKQAAKPMEALLRWPCRLQPPTKANQHWSLSIANGWQSNSFSYSGLKATYNQHWLQWATNETQEDNWAELLNNCLQAGQDSLKHLSLLVQKMMEQQDWQSATVQPALRALHSISADEQNDGQAHLYWSASIVANQDCWQAIDASQIDWQASYDADATADYLNLLRLDPKQYEALSRATQERFVLARGGNSAGKSHVVIEGIKGHLLAGQSCLIVAREKGSLRRIEKALKQAKLEDYYFYWQQEQTDLTIFQSGIQAAARKTNTLTTQEVAKWQAGLGRQNRNIRVLRERYKASRKTVFDGSSWLSTLGRYLSQARIEGKELLASQLQAAQFKFNEQEFDTIKREISKTQLLYKDIGNVHHPLSNLNAAIFIHQSFDESKLFIERTSGRLLEQAKRLHKSYVKRQSRYADELATYYESCYIRLRTQLEKLNALREDATNEFGADMMASSQGVLKLYGTFSGRFKKAISRREQIAVAYAQLAEVHQSQYAFSFEFPDFKINKLLDELVQLLADYEQQLMEWRGSFVQSVQEEMFRLNHKTALSELKASADIMPLEQSLEDFIDELNASGLYQLPLRSKNLTLSKQQKNLEDIIAQLEHTRAALTNYESFFYWQKNWFSLTEASRRTIQALLRAQPQNWEAAFASWYLNENLNQAYVPFPAIEEQTKGEAVDEVNLLRLKQTAFIQYTWLNPRNAALSQLKNNLRTPAATLTHLLAENGKAIADYYPVCLASPELASLLAPYYQHVFLENAQSLSANEVLPIAAHSQKMLCIVDNDEEAFKTAGIGQFLSAKGVASTQLNYQHGKNFAREALALGQNIRFYQLDGRFDEQAKTNEVEALEVLKILNNIQPTPQKTFPSVGVVCMTIEQRNAILEFFYRIKKDRLTGVETLQQLERNGLSVITAEELVGQDFDQIILTAVHAPIDIKGHLSPYLSQLNEPYQRATLTALESCIHGSTHWHVLSSMPMGEIDARLEWADQPGEQHFARIIKLLSLVAQFDYNAAYELGKTWDLPAQNLEGNYLAEELKYRLSPHLPDWTFSITKLENIKHPLLIAKHQTTKVVLLADGFVSETPNTTLDWEYEQQHHLMLSKYKLISFSAEGLWKDPSFSCLRIANKLEACLLEEEEE